MERQITRKSTEFKPFHEVSALSVNFQYFTQCELSFVITLLQYSWQHYEVVTWPFEKLK